MKTFGFTNCEPKQIKPNMISTTAQKMNEKPTFIMKQNQCLVKILNSGNNLGNNQLKNECLLVKLLLPEKHLGLEQKSINTDSVNKSQIQNQVQHKMLLWIPKKCTNTTETDSTAHNLVETKDTKRLKVEKESEEPESDLISDDQFFKYLDLIQPNKLRSEDKSSLSKWPLRSISCVKSWPKSDTILTDIYQSSIIDETQDISRKVEPNREISRRNLAKNEWINEVKDNTNRLIAQKELTDEKFKLKQKELKQSKKDSMNLMSNFDLSSNLGKRIFRSLFKSMNDLEKYLEILKSEQNCLNDIFKYLSINQIYLSDYKNSLTSVSRITRTSGYDWSSRNFQHKYYFNRKQRLEKWKRLETGLDWRARLLKSKCKRLSIKLNRIINCPICSQTIGSQHRCPKTESEFNNSYFCANNYDGVQQNEEFIILEDDFNRDLLESDNELIIPNDELICETDYKSPHEEDEDVILVEEVVKQKSNNVLLLKQMLTEHKNFISTHNSSQLTSIMFSQNRNLNNDNSLTQIIHNQNNDFVYVSNFSRN